MVNSQTGVQQSTWGDYTLIFLNTVVQTTLAHHNGTKLRMCQNSVMNSAQSLTLSIQIQSCIHHKDDLCLHNTGIKYGKKLVEMYTI